MNRGLSSRPVAFALHPFAQHSVAYAQEYFISGGFRDDRGSASNSLKSNDSLGVTGVLIPVGFVKFGPIGPNVGGAS
jgi:hypothetical protein